MGLIRNNIVVEYNDKGYLMNSESFPGAYTRGREREEALSKFPAEIKRYYRWAGIDYAETDIVETIIVQSKESDLEIHEADSDIIFLSEQEPLLETEYKVIKKRVLQSAHDFQMLYDSIPDKNYTSLPKRKSFYGAVPNSPEEIYEHTNGVTNYYTGEIGVELNNIDDIYQNRIQALKRIEEIGDFLQNKVFQGSYGEQWSLRKVLRRFIWHDYIHAKGMYRMAVKEWAESKIQNPYYF
ncbi:hypothetical protein [Oceanobacillus neutriphilus]|uniref:DinB family protein n=1 Tax=Oceanobacillus neutriphilus TaxID=531815 RepID=A0ABQ2NVW3_9BACI|nr:hypothetical protein [Oceanobacillus neutriphilus]GGP11832.1 hypothetical protein GCM10011346_25410 [Oceanobacillus neutriphilus]